MKVMCILISFHESNAFQLLLVFALVGAVSALVEEEEPAAFNPFSPFRPGLVARAETTFLFTRTVAVSS